MKTKTFLSDLTPPRHTGLFAKLKGLRFMLVMLLATLGVNSMWGADIVWTAPTSATATEYVQNFDDGSSVLYGKSATGSNYTPAEVTSKWSMKTTNSGGLWIVPSTAISKVVVNYSCGSTNSGNITYGVQSYSKTGTPVKADFTTTTTGTATFDVTASANKNVWYDKEFTIDVAANKILYIKFPTNVNVSKISLTPAVTAKYTVTFNANGGTCGTSSLTEASAGAGVTLPSATPADEDTQELKGWAVSSTETDPAKIFAAGAKYEPSANTTLYAIYGAKTVKSAIVYANTKGASTAALPTQYTEGVGVAEFAALEDVTGFHFTGWNPSSISASATGEQTITAEWEVVVTPYFVMNYTKPSDSKVESIACTNGSVADANASGKALSLETNDIKFGGNDCRLLVTLADATIVEGTKIEISWISLYSDGTKTGIAVLNENNANQTMDVTGIGGTLKTETGTESYTFTAATAANYSDQFIITRNGTGKSLGVTAIKVYNVGPAIAKWNVTFDMQGATSAAIEAQSVKNGQKAVKPEDPEKTGFNFVKWVVASTEADYDFDAAVTADVALKAVWEEITTSYTVTYNANGGTCATPSATWTGGDALVLPAAEFTDKLFDGWYDSEDNLIGKAGAEYTPTDNIELIAHYSYENKLKKAVFSNGFDAFINEDAKIVNVYYLDGSAEPTLTTGTASLAVCTVSETDGKLVVTAPDDSFVEYTLTKTAVTPAAIGEYTFDGSEDWVKAPYGFDVENNRGWKYSKNADDGRVEKGNNRQYYFVAACEKLVLHTASGITNDRNIFVYVNNVKVDAITKAPKYNAAGSYIEIPCNGSAAMVAVVSNQTGGDGGFGKADVVAHEVSTDATLSALSVADNTITPAFDAATYEYTCELPYGTAAVPAVSYTLADANATAVKTDAASVTGTTSIVVTAEDGTTQLTYTIQFSVAAAPAATPVITVQPASHDYLDTEVIAALTVEATVSDEGVLSYQWYKGEVAIAEATAASYTPTEAGSYKVVVTNTLGTETAEVESEVAVITISHIYTFASWTEGVSFTKTGEWTMTTSDGNGVAIEDAANTKFATDKQIDDATAKATAFTGQYFVVEFAKDMKKVELNAWRSSTTLNSGKVYVHNGTKFVEISYTANNSYLDPAGKKHIHKYVYDIHFEAGKTYFFKLGNAENIYDFFATESAKVSEFAGLTAGKIGDADMTEAQLAELNGAAHTLTLTDAVSVAPAVKFTYKETETYDDEYVKTLKEVKDAEAVSARVADNYEISKEIEGVTYKVVVPVDVTPTLALDVTSGTAAISGKTDRSKEFTITLTGANLVDGNYNVTVPTVDGLTVTPAAFTVAAGEVNETFTITYASDEDVAENTANIVFPVGATTATFTLTYSSAAYVAPTYTAVSASRTWDWKQASSTTSEMKDGTSPARDTEFLLSDVVETSEDFHSENLKMAGQYAVRKDGSKYYFQGNSLKLTTTIEGVLEVYFSNTASKSVARNLFVNGKTTGIGDKTGSENAAKAIAVVQPGEIELNAYLADGSSEDKQYVRIYKVVFTALDEYAFDATIRSGLTNGKLVTMCQAQSIEAMDGAVPFEVEKATAIGIDLVEATFPLVAGKPYILEANKADVRVVYGTDEATEVVPANGLIGNLSSATEDIVIPTWTVEEQYYIFQNNHICKTSTGNYITRDRAYLRKDLVNAVAPAPGRRRISMTTDEVNTPTGLDALMQQADIQKVMIDGHVFIIREGKMFNAVGQMVK